MKNLLLITIDTLRADHVGCYGYLNKTTPEMDRIGKQGAILANAYAPMPTTAPSHISLFSSLVPRSHRVLKNGWKIHGKIPWLPEVLKEKGYCTAAIVSSFALDSTFGFNRGFHHYDDDFERSGSSIAHCALWEGMRLDQPFDRIAKHTTHSAIQWLSERGEEPFFLWVHYFDPHFPYAPPKDFLRSIDYPPPYGKRGTLSSYDGEIRYTDYEVGRLIRFIDTHGLSENTLLAITADHGEGLGQHGWLEHGLHLYEEAVKIPLILRLPGVIPPQTILSTPVELIDLSPTLLHILGLPVPGSFQGTSFFKILFQREGNTAQKRIFLDRRLYSSARELGVPVKGEKIALVEGGYKYIVAPQEGTEELYSLLRDPEEKMNLMEKEGERAGRMRKLVEEWRKRLPPFENRQTLTGDVLKKFKLLGYVE